MTHDHGIVIIRLQIGVLIAQIAMTGVLLYLTEVLKEIVP